MFIPQTQPHAQSLFLFPIVFGINLIHFFDFFDEKEERCNRKFDRLLSCFEPLSITPFDSAKNANCFEKCNVFGNGKCELSAIQEGRNWGANFWQGKAQNSSPILRCTFLVRRSAKLIANFSAKMVTSLPSFSLSLSVSLSLSPNVPHAQYRKRFRASYNKTVVCDCVLTLYRPCAYPGAVLRHASGPTGPRNSSRSFSPFIKSSFPGSSKSRCSRKETKPSLSKINNSTLKMKLFLSKGFFQHTFVVLWFGPSTFKKSSHPRIDRTLSVRRIVMSCFQKNHYTENRASPFGELVRALGLR